MKVPCAALLLACCVLIGGCAAQPKQNVVLEPGDTISFSLYIPDDLPEIPVIRLKIDDHGAVTLLLVGAIEIAGLTTTQAATKIHDAYVKYYPEVIVVVRKVASAKR